MEKINEITTKDSGVNAFDIIRQCKEIADMIDITNIILDNTSIDEKEMLIKLIESVRNLELQIIDYEPHYIPKVKA